MKDLHAQLESIQDQLDSKIKELSDLIKALGEQSRGDATALGLLDEIRNLQSEGDRIAAQLAQLAGVTLDEIDSHLEVPNLDRKERYWIQQLSDMPPTADLDEILPSSLERLESIVDPSWLRDQAKLSFRLDGGFTSEPLEIAFGTRLERANLAKPQRFARMLLVCRDHLNKRDDLDFFSASLFAAEIAMLGHHIKAIDELGPEGTAALTKLPLLTEQRVASTVHELLVGGAAIARGRDAEMLKPRRGIKTADLRIHDWAVPIVIECKRRLGPNEFELKEANAVRRLYDQVRQPLLDANLHISLEITFTAPIDQISHLDFSESVTMTASAWEDVERAFPWGTVVSRRLNYTSDFDPTRLYSPSHLAAVYDWPEEHPVWDGIICELENQGHLIVRSARAPLCLKWRSTHPDGEDKKARGVTTLFGEATKQIPSGEMGIIHIVYPEGARADLADARTRAIMEQSKEWTHDWGKVIPLVVVERLYARSRGVGVPDLIASAMPLLAADADPIYKSLFPTSVFSYTTLAEER